jgi:hemerythrin
MEQWAAGPLFGSLPVNFHCICVDDESYVAKSFSQMFRFSNVINSWCPPRARPTYGQLGCGGFIIIGADGWAVSTKTMAFTQVGPQRAFADAEGHIQRAIRAIETASPAPLECKSLSNNQGVRVVGTSRSDLNHKLGTTVSYDDTRDRWTVRLENDQLVSLKSVNLETAYHTASVNLDSSVNRVILTAIEPPALIGCVAVDDEHRACTATLNDLLQATAAVKIAPPMLLHRVISSLESHFQHEEELALEAGFGNTGSDKRFSAFETHKADHLRIMHLARQACVRAEQAGAVNYFDAEAIAQAFLQHANQYDVLLEGKLGSCP